MKRWIALVMLLLVLLPGCAPAEKEPRYRVVEHRYEVVGDVPASITVYSYDENDRLAHSVFRSEQSDLCYELYYIYKRDGQNTWRTTEMLMDGVRSVGDKELLDKNGNVLESWNVTENGEFTLRKTYAYDKAGNKIFERSYTEDGEALYTHCWEYDKCGNETRVYSYKGADDEAVTYYEKETYYTYDEHDWPVEVLVCQTDLPGITTCYTNVYREDGTLESRTGLYENESYFIERYNQTGVREYYGYFAKDGSLWEETVWEFDEHGNVVATETRYSSDEVHRTEMVYETY